MSNRELLTVEAFKAFQRANAAAHAEAEEQVRASMVDALLRHVAVRMHWGLQAACQDAWRCIGRHVPYTHKDLAAETLEKIGWVRRQKRERAE
ncbi:hypothetical protein [Ralstonia pseudosolanacearum]|uniref:hypothetical protein n=1 Tax=Ralstonia pseudosolanacearum TaxID=1310165 RepID=UPI002676F476|nr:hypothetical protein [Ralstonia pseudosolanacearum]MDO3553087.1 hypothetical protein [Ralstonia pseudosolanacearum]MDO3582229.1 hypothetical protein [Ralstonia pseudosolanacearum]